MTTITPNAPLPAPGIFPRLMHGLAGPWRGPADVRDPAYTADHDPRVRLATLAGVVLLGLIGGLAVAFAGAQALVLAAALIGCLFILYDFRVGVVLLLLLV